MTVQPTKRQVLYFDQTLFPNGISPGSRIELKGASGSGKTYLITYLIAKFLVTYPHGRVIFVNTRHHFNLPTFLKLLVNLSRELKESLALNFSMDNEEGINDLKANDLIIKYLERLTIIPCFTSEQLAICLGGIKDGYSMIEKMLEYDCRFSLVFIDCLNNFAYCPTVKCKSTMEDNLDFCKLLLKFIKSTDTPVICTMLNLKYKPPTVVSKDETTADPPNSSQYTSSSIQSNSELNLLQFNINFDPMFFTHTIFLESQPVPNINITFLCKAYLRSKKSPKNALSGTSHFVKFSISSGILKWQNQSE